MEREQKLLLGRILGEILRLQRRSGQDVCGSSKQEIYGLVTGIEAAIDDAFGLSEPDHLVTNDQVETLERILNEAEPAVHAGTFGGWYEIESKLEEAGMSRSDAIRILTWMQLGGTHPTVEAIMQKHRPVELHDLDPNEFEI